jgi:hypothetical protein
MQKKDYYKIKNFVKNFNIKIDDSFVGTETFIWRLRKKRESLIRPAKQCSLKDRIDLIIYELKKRNVKQNYFIIELLNYWNNFTGLKLHKTKNKKCKLCGLEFDPEKTKFSFLSICQNCLRAQVRYNIDYINCNRTVSGRYCLDCPTKIYEKCPVINKTNCFNNIDKNITNRINPTPLNINRRFI